MPSVFWESAHERAQGLYVLDWVHLLSMCLRGFSCGTLAWHPSKILKHSCAHNWELWSDHRCVCERAYLCPLMWPCDEPSACSRCRLHCMTAGRCSSRSLWPECRRNQVLQMDEWINVGMYISHDLFFPPLKQVTQTLHPSSLAQAPSLNLSSNRDPWVKRFAHHCLKWWNYPLFLPLGAALLLCTHMCACVHEYLPCSLCPCVAA